MTLSPAAVRRLRVAAAAGLVLGILGGAGGLWFATRSSEPGAAESARRAEARAPVRLDTLPRTGSATSAGETSPAGPVEDRDALASEQRPEGDRPAGQREPRRPSQDRGPHADLAALAAENDRVEAALSGYDGEEQGTGEIVWPVDAAVLLGFGWPSGRAHAGIDIRASSGSSVHAADWGEVVFAGTLGAYGKVVCLQHTQTLATCYAHLSRVRVSEGESVGSGDVIAKSGCTGSCLLPHLHFEVREDGEPVNPRDFLGAPLSAID